MGWVDAPNTVWVSLGLKTPQLSLQNSLYFELNSGVLTRPVVHALIADIRDWHVANVLPLLSSEVSFFNIGGTDMTTISGFTEFIVEFSPPAGGSGDGLPMNSVFTVYFETGVPGRSFRGENNVSGIPLSERVGPYVTSGWAEALRTAYDELFAIASANDFTWVVCSRHTAGADRAVALNTPITTVVWKNNIISTWGQRAPGRHT